MSALGGRSKRRRSSSAVDAATSAAKAASFACSYCAKDLLASQMRLKCAVCPNVDLCVECFSVGVEINRHTNNHAYRGESRVPYATVRGRSALMHWRRRAD